jgi:DNA-binding XRE family transcriptional regulator
MAKEKTYTFKRNNPALPIPKGGYIASNGNLLMPRLMKPKELAKYDLVDLNKGYTKLTIYRSAIGMKQQTLSDLTGISIRTLQGWELNGLNVANVVKAVKIADALKCNVKDLLEEE